MVFIGADIDWPALTAKLDEALVPDVDVEMIDFDTWSDLSDPFPHWRKQEASS